MDVKTPVSKDIYLKSSLVNDNSKFLKVGSQEEYTFQSFDTSDTAMPFSSWTNFPTPENPTSKYKYASLSFFVDRNLHSIYRETYGLLDWMGDCGGLLDALFFIGKIIMFPYSSYAL